MRLNIRAIGCPSVLCLAGAAAAQCPGDWTNPNVALPVHRQAHAMAYDAARSRIVMFGGFSTIAPGFLQDTWTFNGSAWVQVGIGGPAPSTRAYHAMAYDSARQRTILFGGFDGTWRHDTWEWNGTAWSEVATTGDPQGRQSPAMAYDSARQRIVLFGGQDNNGAPLGDTWEYNPATAAWVQFTPAAAPEARYESAMAFDSARGVCVLFGGQTSQGLNNNTWEWNGADWLPVFGAAPPARTAHAMVFDSARQRTLLFGGLVGVAFGMDTWTRAGAGWTQTATAISPSPRYYHAMAYDAGRSSAVLFGGSNGNGSLLDTWEFFCPCYANCDGSSIPPILNVADFVCFMNRFAAGHSYANCDNSTIPPVLNVADFSCFLNRFGAGCP